MGPQKKIESRTKLVSKKRDDIFILNFENAYRRNFEKLYKYAKVITLSEEIAKDVVSDVFFNLWNMKRDFAEIKELDSYLFIATKNHAIRMISQDPGNFVTLEFENSLKTIENLNPEDLLLSKELDELIDRAVESLPDQCKLVFEMVKKQQLKHKEVADQLNITVGTVKNQVIKALSRIRIEIHEFYNKRSGNDFYESYTKIISISLLIATLFPFLF